MQLILVCEYLESSNDFGKIQTNANFEKHLFAFKLGKEDGKNFDISNKIENEVDEKQLLG